VHLPFEFDSPKSIKFPLATKWDSLCKHVGKKKTKRNIGINVEKGDWYHSKYYKHAKNYKLPASYNLGNVTTQLENGVARENRRKVVQFVTIVHLLQQSHPMQEYEAIKPLYEFLVVPKNSKEHWNDNSGWTMKEAKHWEVMKATRVVMGVALYVVLSCDEVSRIDNQSWLYVHYYVVQNWVKNSILISLDRMLEGSSSDNLTNVIMEA
jgi:hypothetical protein